jgi:hypothetical protein
MRNTFETEPQITQCAPGYDRTDEKKLIEVT